MSTRALVLCAASLSVACGGANTNVAPTDACAEQAERAEETRGIHERCAAEGGEVSDDEAAYQALAEALATHRASLGDEPSLTDAEAMGVADGYWAYLDRIASHFTDHAPLDRAEDAAEALMRDRSGDAAIEAADASSAALEELHALLGGDSPPVRCAEEAEIAEEARAALDQCRAEGGPT